MDNLNSFKNIIIYILNKTWSSSNNTSYKYQWIQIQNLFGFRVEHRSFQFRTDNLAMVLDFNLLLESEEKKINITLYNGGVGIDYMKKNAQGVWLVQPGGLLKRFEKFEARNNIEKAQKIIDMLQTFLSSANLRQVAPAALHNKSAENSTSNYSFGSLQYF